TGETDDPQKDISKTASTQRPIAPAVDDGKKGKPFKEVLNKKDEKKATVIAARDEDEEEEVSLFDLAGQPPVQKTRKILSTLDQADDGGTETPVPTLPEADIPYVANTALPLKPKFIPASLTTEEPVVEPEEQADEPVSIF